MTLDEARVHIGDTVVYRPMLGLPEAGVLTGASSIMAFVWFAGVRYPQATRPGDLELAVTAAGREE